MGGWRIVHRWGLVGCLVALSVCACAQEPMTPRDDVVAILLTEAATPRGVLTITYPKVVSQAQVQEDLGAMEEVGGWRFGPVALETLADETQAVAVMRPAADMSDAYGEPAWPAVWALRRYNRVTVVVMGENYRGSVGGVENRFVDATWSGGGNLWSYDVVVKDRSFGSLVELRAPAESEGSQAPAPGRHPYAWVALVAAAAGVGVLVYLLVARAIRRPDPEARREAKTYAARRARRARNATK